MTKNAVGVVFAVAALVAVFYFGHPAQKTAPAPEKPIPTTTIVKPPTAPSKPGKNRNPNPNPAVIYHRVEQGGKRGPEVACTSVKLFAEGKTPAELAALAKQYGASVAEVQRWYICAN